MRQPAVVDATATGGQTVGPEPQRWELMAVAAPIWSETAPHGGDVMTGRINRAIELLLQDQAIYYAGHHTGHVLTAAQGREDAQTWADYINIGMEHGAFDMTGLTDYMRGLVEGGPTRSG